MAVSGNHTAVYEFKPARRIPAITSFKWFRPEMDNMASNSVFQAVENIQANQPYTLSFWMRIIDARGSLMVDGGGGKIAATIPFNNALFSPTNQQRLFGKHTAIRAECRLESRCPKPNASVEVQARITDSDGVNRAELHFLPFI
jgi:hypothetical protein